ncbi:MAG TPA: hypothetical protein VE465_28860 [Streptosporangiaceae bacterium]|jgi:hypothetical protein|nr:hypothetical protein [Streptosporangiaceae bacterium]
MPRVKRVPKQSTVRFIAMLRALDRALGSFDVSHAEVERRLCDWLAAGRRAEEALRNGAREGDREGLATLINRKTAVELSGLVRMDGRRDRAGGQRIGELVTGRFPRGSMPSRRRVEVCVDVFLAILEENDPTGYANGMYGTRESWRQWWLQADQGHEPEIGDPGLTVWGYLDEALEELTAALQRPAPEPAVPWSTANGPTGRGGADHGERRAPGTPGVQGAPDGAAPGGPSDGSAAADGLAVLAADPVLDRVRREAAERVATAEAERDAQIAAYRAEADRRVQRAEDDSATQIATARAERDQALAAAHDAERAAQAAAERAEAAEERVLVAQVDARAKRDEALRNARTARLRLVVGSIIAAIAVVAVTLWYFGIGPPGGGRATHTVQLAAPAQEVSAVKSQQVAFSFVPPLPRNKNWTLNIKLSVIPTDLVSACTFEMRMTARVEVDGRALSPFTSDRGQTTITRVIHLGDQGDRSLRLVVTRLDTDPECRLRLDPLGSHATAIG